MPKLSRDEIEVVLKSHFPDVDKEVVNFFAAFHSFGWTFVIYDDGKTAFIETASLPKPETGISIKRKEKCL